MNPFSYFDIPVNDMPHTVRFYASVFECQLTLQTIDGNERAQFPFTEGGSGSSGRLAKGDSYIPA